MSGFFKRNSSRREFRVASALLMAGCFLTALAPVMMGLPSSGALVAAALSIASFFALAILTYNRLRDASLSGWWLLPMFIVIHTGPEWQLGSWWWGSASFSPSGFLAFLPVALGWFAVGKDGEHVPDNGTQAG